MNDDVAPLNPKKAARYDRGFATLPLITASPLSALVDRAAFFGFNSKIETARSLVLRYQAFEWK